ncbi:hypothetical protein bcgnr5396_53340 [Bacillus cereus]
MREYTWFISVIINFKYINGNVLSTKISILYISEINDSCYEINKIRLLNTNDKEI